MPVSGSHSRTVPSLPALACRCPSGLNATALTSLLWPVRGRPVSTFPTLIKLV